MKHVFPTLLIALLCGAPALAQVRPAPVPIVLPHAPPVTNATSSALWQAMLAIGRAQQIDPQAAQRASFQYTQAVQQYRIGNTAGANASAVQALSIAGGAQVQPLIPAALATPFASGAPGRNVPGGANELYGASAPAIDADAFLALARGMLDDCAARHDPHLTEAQRHYAKAQHDAATQNWQATRIDAKAAIDACAKPQP